MSVSCCTIALYIHCTDIVQTSWCPSLYTYAAAAARSRWSGFRTRMKYHMTHVNVFREILGDILFQGPRVSALLRVLRGFNLQRGDHAAVILFLAQDIRQNSQELQIDQQRVSLSQVTNWAETEQRWISVIKGVISSVECCLRICPHFARNIQPRIYSLSHCHFLRVFITARFTGEEPRQQFAIGLTVKQISQNRADIPKWNGNKRNRDLKSKKQFYKKTENLPLFYGGI